MDVLRTPDSRFANLHGYPFAPHYVDVAASDTENLRMHYVEADSALLHHVVSGVIDVR
jgi:haloalkane dehalogenase